MQKLIKLAVSQHNKPEDANNSPATTAKTVERM